MAGLDIGSLFNFVLKRKPKKGGQSYTTTYDPQSQDGLISAPRYRDHLTDLFQTRYAQDSRTLLAELFKSDPDVSAAVNGFLTMANTDMILYATDMDGQIDRDATKQLEAAVKALENSRDYTQGFAFKPSLRSICESLRWMLLLRGAIGVEVILDEQLAPNILRNVDMATIEWLEKAPGVYKPQQAPANSNDKISLDIPNFFVAYFRRDPTSVYGYPFFASAINTIAARQMVINDLYRIMTITGWSRLDIKIVEEVIRKNMPAAIRGDATKEREWVNARLAEIRGQLQTIRPDQPFTHTDSVEVQILNDRNPGSALDITPMVETLNAQNQAGLKQMATILGRGSAGVNTSSVESRIAAMNADELNHPVAEVLAKSFSFLLHQNGYQGFANVKFSPAELRPDLELEPQRTLRSSRLRQDLSDGLITDDEYHLWMYGRLRPDSAPELSGTGFMNADDAATVDAQDVTPNSDPLGRSMAPEGSSAARSNGVSNNGD